MQRLVDIIAVAQGSGAFINRVFPHGQVVGGAPLHIGQAQVGKVLRLCGGVKGTVRETAALLCGADGVCCESLRVAGWSALCEAGAGVGWEFPCFGCGFAAVAFSSGAVCPGRVFGVSSD